MKSYYSYLILLVAPVAVFAGEQSKGTLIMMSSVGGWASIAIALSFYRRSRRFKGVKKTISKD